MTGMLTQPGRPGVLRSMNDRTALGLLISGGPMTRQQIGEATGLSGPTTSQLITRLTEAGLVDEAGTTAGGRGPNAVIYRALTEAVRGVALHMDRGRMIAQVVDAGDHKFPVAEVPLTGRERSAEGDLRAAIDAACEAAGLAGAGIVAVCVAVPGAVSPSTDDLRFVGPLQGWPRRAVRAQLEAQLGLSVMIENDANLAAVAEASEGSGHGDFALLWQGEGLGVASVTGGQVYRGASGGAGEIGYLPVSRGAVAIDEAARDLQDLAGSGAITGLARAHRRSIHSYEAALKALREGPLRPALLAELAPRTAEVLVPVLAVLDPALVVLGGPTGAAGGADLASLVQTRLRRTTRWRTPVLATAVPVRPVLRGAALTLAQHLADRLLGQIG